MTHGDDQGLILPPRLAPIQVVVIPIFRSDVEKSLVLETVERVSRELRNAGIRFKVDDREEVTPGRKYFDWEMRGIPLRIEIGPKDVEKNNVALARRDKPGKEGKSFISQENLAAIISEMMTPAGCGGPPPGGAAVCRALAPVGDAPECSPQASACASRSESRQPT